MSEKRGFDEMAEESRPYGELMEIKQECVELKRECYRLCLCVNRLASLLQLKEQKLDHLYWEMHYLAEIPRAKKDRNRIRRFVQTVESRMRDQGNDEFLFINDPIFFSDVGLRRKGNKSKRRHGYEEELLEIYSLADMWHNDQRGNGYGWY